MNRLQSWFLDFEQVLRVRKLFACLKQKPLVRDKIVSWKVPSEVRKNRMKLERTVWSWKEPSEVGKFLLKLESFPEVGTQFQLSNFSTSFPTSARTFQLQSVLSNFTRFFATSLGSFQLQTFQLLVISNFLFKLHVSHWNLSPA